MPSMRRFFWVGLIVVLLIVGAAMQLRAQLAPAEAPVSKGQATKTATEYVTQRLQRLGTSLNFTRTEAELGWAPETVFNPQAGSAGTPMADRRTWIVKLFYKGLTPDTHLVVYVDANSGEPAGGTQTKR